MEAKWEGFRLSTLCPNLVSVDRPFYQVLVLWLHIIQRNDTVDASEIPCPTTVWMVLKPYR